MSQHFVASAPTCPHCSALLDGASAAPADGPDRGPQVGDPTICAYCAEPLMFDGDPLMLRAPTSDELVELMTYGEFMRALAFFRHQKATGRLPPPPAQTRH